MRKLRLSELGRLSVEEFKKAPKIRVTVVLDNIRSGMNVGSMFRTCDAFRIEKIFLTGITAIPPHREILKTAIGASQSVDWEYVKEVTEAVSRLKRNDYKIIGVEQTDKSMPLMNFEIERQNSYAIIFGNEVNGLTETLLPELDVTLDIPQFGTKHSLNVAVCAGIVLYSFGNAMVMN